MKKNKGFTLIELLAVIVVLAVIAIIAIPLITNVIDKAKQGALKDSGYGILESAEMYLAKNMSTGITDTMEFICNNGTCLSGTEEINYKGSIDSGRIRIYSDNKIELCIENDNSSALKTVASKEVVVSKGTCNYEELNYGVTALVSKTALDEANKKYNDLKSLVDQIDVTADDIKEGKKVLINGEIITGTNKGTNKIYLGGSGTYNLKTNYATYGLGENDWKNITINNILLVSSSTSRSNSFSTGVSSSSAMIWIYAQYTAPSASYTSSTGVLSVSNGLAWGWNDGFYQNSVGTTSISVPVSTYLVY